MKVDPALSRALVEVARSRSDRLAELVRVAKLDPAKDFRGADLSGADLRGEDLRDFDFTGAAFKGAMVHGALFNDTVSEEQLASSKRRNHAMVLMLGHADSKAFRAEVHALPRDFTFNVDLSRKLDEYREQRNRLVHGRAGKSQQEPAALFRELDDAAAETDALFVLLTSASASAADVASEVLARKLPGRRGVAIAAHEQQDPRGGPRRNFVRFKNGRVDDSWGSVQSLQEVCEFLRISRSSTPLLEVPWRKMRGAEKTHRYPTTIMSIRRPAGMDFGEAIYTSVTYEGWGSNLNLRLYVSDTAYNRGSIIEGLRGRTTGSLEVYSFRSSKSGRSADAYAVLAEPDSTLWGALGDSKKEGPQPA